MAAGCKMVVKKMVHALFQKKWRRKPMGTG